MFSTYTANYTKIKSGYMGQLVEWPEVVTEGKTLEECRAILQDALHEMILAYRQQKKARVIPFIRTIKRRFP
jgi:predicted RNase H-like HicB family nuclease